MLAENFVGGTILFDGDSGVKIGNKWRFTNRPNFYAVNPVNWYMSEKLDGVRAFWSSKTGFLSRNNNPFHAPIWFDEKMRQCCKDVILDGELYISGKDASFVSGTVRRKNSEKDWNRVCFFVFDIIGLEQDDFEKRTTFLKSLLKTCKDDHFIYLPQIKVENMEHAYEFYKHIITSNGEGVVFKNTASLYEHKRSHNLLKWKPLPTSEAQVIGFKEGTGKYKNKLGVFEVKLDNGIKFNLSGKMTDHFRSQYVFKNHELHEILSDSVPHINDWVTYEYMTLTIHGIPRQAVFLGLRILND